MELWLIYILITYFTWACTFIADKYLLDKKLKNNLNYTIFVGIVNSLVIFLIPFADFSKISLIYIIFGLSIGGLIFISFIFLFKALKCDDISIVIPLGSLKPIIVLILSIIFLKEVLNSNEIIAFILFFIGGAILSIRELSLRKIKVTPALKYLSINCTLSAINAVLIKHLLSVVPVFEGYILFKMGIVITTIVFLFNKKVRKSFKLDFSGLSIKSRSIFISNQIIALGSHYTLSMAISLASISLINAARGAQLVFVFIITLLVSRFFPNILKEDIDKKIILKKIAGIFFVILALYFLSI